ncbi:hypothetical protein [Paludibacterium purpuratum]|uniref:Uncharacterized protein n=1 Tax=Paludibacterium purpuratum TaxID=1144873 RepID=A0A4R7BCT1_9NEIS|nr:hypothetical protein [Paludibacterium purpuratum]TDR82771.1 hypothetical protein DFP86_101160 [Paludibacterium purpuratum]
MTIEVRQMVIRSELASNGAAAGRATDKPVEDDCCGENPLADQPHRAQRAEVHTLREQLERLRER